MTHPDVTRYLIRTSEAISLVLQAATLGNDGQVFMLDMGDPVNIIDLAQGMIRLSNHAEGEIPIVFTGLRTGEKLFEQVSLTGESTHPTIFPQIVISRSIQPDAGFIQRWLARVRIPSAAAAISFVRELAPEYDPAVNTPPVVRPFRERRRPVGSCIYPT